MEGDKAVEGGNVDDATTAALEHLRRKYLAAAQRAGKVGVHDGVPLGLLDFKRGHAPDAPGAVHQNVCHAELGGHSLPQLYQAGSIADVCWFTQRSPAERFNRLSCLLERLHAAAGGDDIRTCCGQTHAQGAPDAAGAAQYNSDLATDQTTMTA